MMEWIKALLPLVATPLAAWLAALVAMNKWRAEMTGKRRAEIAEAVLADLYRVRYQAERGFPKSWNRDAADETKDRAAEGLAKAVSDLMARRFSFAAVFSEAEAAPLEAIPDIIIDEFYPDDGKATINANAKAKLDRLVEAVEGVCRPAIRAAALARPWWKLL